MRSRPRACIIAGEPRLDLCYDEDVTAEVDMNIVCTGTGDFVEVQGTGEEGVFDRKQLNALLDLGVAGCAQLAEMQRDILGLPSLSPASLLAKFGGDIKR